MKCVVGLCVWGGGGVQGAGCRVSFVVLRGVWSEELWDVCVCVCVLCVCVGGGGG